MDVLELIKRGLCILSSYSFNGDLLFTGLEIPITDGLKIIFNCTTGDIRLYI